MGCLGRLEVRTPVGPLPPAHVRRCLRLSSTVLTMGSRSGSGIWQRERHAGRCRFTLRSLYCTFSTKTDVTRHKVSILSGKVDSLFEGQFVTIFGAIYYYIWQLSHKMCERVRISRFVYSVTVTRPSGLSSRKVLPYAKKRLPMFKLLIYLVKVLEPEHLRGRTDCSRCV